MTSEKVLKGGFPEAVPELPETEPGYSYMWLLEDGTLWDSAQAVTSDLDVIAKHYISDFYVTVSMSRDDQGNAILRAEWHSEVDLATFEYEWSFGGSEYATNQECKPVEYGIYIARVTAYDADGVEAYSYCEFDYQSAHTVTFQFPDGSVRTYEVEHNQCLTEIPPLEAPENYRYIWVEDSDRGYGADTMTPITEDVTYKAVLVMTGMTADVGYIDMSNINSPSFSYKDRFVVKLGNFEETEYRFGKLLSAVSQMVEGDRGTIDVSPEGEKTVFSPY